METSLCSPTRICRKRGTAHIWCCVPCCCSAGRATVSWYLLPTGSTAANPLHAVAANGIDRQTDGHRTISQTWLGNNCNLVFRGQLPNQQCQSIDDNHGKSPTKLHTFLSHQLIPVEMHAISLTPDLQCSAVKWEQSRMTYQSNGCVIHVDELAWQWHVINVECYAVEAQLPSNVKTTLLHVHSNQLHRTHASDTATIQTYMQSWSQTRPSTAVGHNSTVLGHTAWSVLVTPVISVKRPVYTSTVVTCFWWLLRILDPCWTMIII